MSTTAASRASLIFHRNILQSLVLLQDLQAMDAGRTSKNNQPLDSGKSDMKEMTKSDDSVQRQEIGQQSTSHRSHYIDNHIQAEAPRDGDYNINRWLEQAPHEDPWTSPAKSRKA